MPPAAKTITKPQFSGSRFTIRMAGIFFLLSAVIEGISITAAVPLFGEIRGGMTAVVYHLLYVVLFFGIGIGLWKAKSWGFMIMSAGTVFYSLDKILYLLDTKVRQAGAARMLGEYGALLGTDGLSLVTQVMQGLTVVILTCWWGFLLYLYFKRDYFKSSVK